MQKKTRLAYNVTKSLIKVFFGGGGGWKAIWRIVRNSEKILATPLVMGYRKVYPKFCCENNIIPNSDALQMLGVTVDDIC